MAGQIAHHYVQSNHPEKAVDYCLLAAAAASRIFANGEAIAFYQRAQSLLPENDTRTIGVLESLGHYTAAKATGRQPSVLKARLPSSTTAVLRRAMLLNEIGRTLIASHQRAQAWEALSSARTLLESTPLHTKSHGMRSGSMC